MIRRRRKAQNWVPGMLNDVPDSWEQERGAYMSAKRASDYLYRALQFSVFAVLIAIFYLLAESVLADVKEGSVLFENTLSTGSDSPSSALWLQTTTSNSEMEVSGGVFPAPTLETDVAMTVSGPILRAKVRQVFSNPSNSWVEGFYSFPLPVNAAVDSMTMTAGAVSIKGEIKEKEEAKIIYQGAKKQGLKTSLLNHRRSNVFTTSVANIAPLEEIIIEFEYQQMLDFKDGQYHLRFPMVSTPKFTPGSSSNASQTPPINLVRTKREGAANPVSIRLELEAGVAIREPKSISHPISVEAMSASSYMVRMNGVAEQSNRDFILSWQPEESSNAQAKVLYEVYNNDVYALMTVVPPNIGNESNTFSNTEQSHANQTLLTSSHIDIPRLESSGHWQRELVFVLDVSGSMQGPSIRQAKAAILEALSGLQSEDRFNIIWFNNHSQSLFSASQYASDSNLNFARQRIISIDANGGTNMAPALNMALDESNQDYDIRQVVFITDGAVGNEHELFDLIRQRLGNSRLFTVGIGSAPNSYFMKKAAEAGKGVFTYVSRPDDAGPKIKQLLRKLKTPALTDLTIDLEGRAAEMFPHTLPDLYLGEPIYISMKLDQLPSEARFSGQVLGQDVWLNLPFEQKEVSGIAKFWAGRKINALETSVREHRADPAYQNSIESILLQTALEHELVSRRTSLVAVDYTPAREKEKLFSSRIKANAPLGWNGYESFSLAQTDAGLYQLLLKLGLYTTVFLLLIFMCRYQKSKLAC